MSDHREHFDWGSISYWARNTASSMGQADVETVDIEAGFGLHKEKLTFQISDGQKIETYKRALDRAVAIGRDLQNKEIRSLLGIKDPRE